jgi:ketosteroid isomerase-like protein
VRAVLAVEDGRFAAMVRADTAWLRDVLADDLSYVHTSGRSDTKAQFLESLGSGTLRYREFTPRERRVRLLGDGTAVVVGLAHARAAAGSREVDMYVRYVAVYERIRERWWLAAWQTTRMP